MNPLTNILAERQRDRKDASICYQTHDVCFKALPQNYGLVAYSIPLYSEYSITAIQHGGILPQQSVKN